MNNARKIGAALENPLDKENGLPNIVDGLLGFLPVIGEFPLKIDLITCSEEEKRAYYLRLNRYQDLHYAIAGPMIHRVLRQLEPRIARHFLDGNDPTCLSPSIVDELQATKTSRDRIETYFGHYSAPIRGAIDAVMNHVMGMPAGEQFIAVGNWITSQLQTSEEQMRMRKFVHFQSMEVDYANQLVGALMLLRKNTDLVAVLDAEYGRKRSEAEVANDIVGSRFIMTLPKIEGSRLIAIDMWGTGCNNSDYLRDKNDEPLAGASHRDLYEKHYKGDPERFRTEHAANWWYDSRRFSLFSSSSRGLFAWTIANFDTVTDVSSAGDMRSRQTPIARLPIISGRHCSAVYDDGIRYWANISRNTLSSPYVLGAVIDDLSRGVKPHREVTDARPWPLPVTVRSRAFDD